MNLSNPYAVEPFEGKVGCLYNDLGIFVTSPNSTHVADPVFGQRTIRMRKDYHFGEEDPLYFPQLFNKDVPHLAVISLPSVQNSHPHTIAWIRPKDSDFIPLSQPNSPGLCTGLGLLREKLRSKMSKAFHTLMEHNIHYLPPARHDPFIEGYISAIQFMQVQLKCPMDQERTYRTWAICQRVYLELQARFTWIAKYADGTRTMEKDTELASVIGALVDNIETATYLYTLRIPLWLVRPLSENNPFLRVDCWKEPQPSTKTLLDRTDGFIVYMEDTLPAQVPVYTGIINNKDLFRYQAMSAFVRQNVVVRLYDLQEQTKAMHESEKQTQLGPQRTERGVSNRFDPFPRKPKGTSTPPPSNRNKFEDVPTNIVPAAYPTWLQASSHVGKGFNPNAHRDSVGYILPDPSLIAAAGLESQNFTIRNSYLDTWLKLRPVFLYRINTSDNKPLKTGVWRTIIGIRALGFHHKKAKSIKEDVESMMEKILSQGNLKTSIDVSKLDEHPSVWRGQPIDIATAPLVLVQEILWELFEINFRYDVLMCDHHWHRGDREDREVKVLSMVRHCCGHLLPDMDSDLQKQCFPSSDIYERQLAIIGMLSVMATWVGRGKLPDHLSVNGLMSRLQDREAEVTPYELQEIEYGMVHHFIEVFAGTFGRAPVLPRSIL
ncbi:hypothetical protein VNI00_007340 [Paramarasmius palmivorus]|uniref:Uncharacterized protein n=1 Tax=Paramarasmius palmivorus TaxID=297713 RepID=A0AAW0D237_9AGAR